MMLGSSLALILETPRISVERQTRGCPPPRIADPDSFEVVFVEEGAGYQQIGSRSFPVQAGDVFLVAPWELRQPDRQNGLTRWVIQFGAEWLRLGATGGDGDGLSTDDLFLSAFLQLPDSVQHHLHIDPTERLRWIARLTSLADELRGRDYGSNIAVHALLRLLLIDVARVARLQVGAVSPQTRPLFLGVFSYIERRFRAPIGLADVAKAVGRSPSYLTDLVRRETGRTVLQWIIYRRIAEARRLLLDPALRVKDVGRHIGYDDTGHFIRQFRRLNGLTPQRWRAQC